LVHRAHQVLPAGQVDRGLAADAAVDHRQQGGGDLDVPDAPQPGRRGKARDIADGAAAERHQGAGAVEPEAGEAIVKAGERLHPLRVLAVWKRVEMGGESSPLQGLEHGLGVRRANRGIGDQKDGLAGAGAAQRRRQQVRKAAPDDDLVR